MWIWFVGGAVLAIILARAASTGGAVRSAYVVVGSLGEQRVASSPVLHAKFVAEIATYHLFGAGLEQLPMGVVSVKGKRDVGTLEAQLPRFYTSVQKTAGPSSVMNNSTMMDITELDALLSGRKPTSITIYIAPRNVALEKSKPGSPLAILD